MKKNPHSLIQLLYRLGLCLDHRRRYQMLLVFLLMLISALAELVSLGAVLPFIAVITAPDHLLAQPVIKGIATFFNIHSSQEMKLPLTFSFIFIVSVASIFRMLFIWVSTRFSYACSGDIGGEVYRRTLYQPYEVHIARNSSQILSGITVKTASVTESLLAVLTLLSSFILFITILFAFVAIDPVVALVAILSFGISYLLISQFSRRRLLLNSKCVARENTHVIKALQEGIGGIRDILIDGTQEIYSSIYQESNYALKSAQASNTFIGQSPRFGMEAFGVILIACLAYQLSLRAGGITIALQTLGALALGAQRLLPALQQSYQSWSSIVGNYGSLSDVVNFLEQPMPPETVRDNKKALFFKKDIHLKNIGFRYHLESPWILNNLTLTIPKGARVALVGLTGSGKSTTLDLLMGLLRPTVGELWVDDNHIQENNVCAWQKCIAHVPQAIYLTDATMVENIAFGVAVDKIDFERVKMAARLAQIDEFIEGCAEGYNTYVGERGVRLSGGQRQRIGIARALYKKATVLIFDEATSALDNSTEFNVMKAIQNLDRRLTVIIVAHRLTTVQHCDFIVELRNGQIVSQGSYKDVIEHSESFRHISQLNA